MIRIMLLSIFILTVSACCRKTYECDKSGLYLAFANYGPAEIDSLTILRYKAGTNFAILEDVITTEIRETDTAKNKKYLINNQKSSATDEVLFLDLIVINPILNDTFRLTEASYDIRTYTKHCTTMGVNKCLSPATKIRINGVEKYANNTDEYIYIKK